MEARSACIFFSTLENRHDTILLLPRPASAEDSAAGAVVGLWAGEAGEAGEAVAPAAEWEGGLEVILGVTTAGEPGPRSIRLSSVASLNI